MFECTWIFKLIWKQGIEYIFKESIHLELKKEYVKDILKTVIAFANTSGGKIYIGIDDDDKGIRPSGVYVRQGASSVPATDAAILKMIRDTDGDNFEELRSLNQNLDFDLFKKEFEYSFLNRYNRTNSEITGLKRTDTREYPEIAIREALLNSIVHKEYSYSSSTLISIFDDKIEMVTIGGLTKGLSEDDIMLGVSILRNRNLANIFYRLKLIEAYGTGIPKIIESYNEYNVKPKIEISSNAFKITLPNTLKEKSSSKFEKNLSDKEYLIVNMLKENEYIKRTDIENNLSISSSMAIKLLRNMVENSIIEKLGKGKNVIYKLK